MDVVVTIGAATAAVELLIGLFFAFLVVRLRSEREYRIAALLGLVAAARGWAGSIAAHASTVARARVGERGAGILLLFALALCVHFAAAYRGRVQSLRVMGLYAAGGVLALLGPVLSASDSLHSLGLGLGLGGDSETQASALGLAIRLSAVAAAAVTLFLLARAYLAGRTGALPVVMGATVLLATTLSDVGYATGAIATGYLVDAGLAALLVSIATTPTARYASVSRELERCKQELRSRTQELRNSYEELRTAQEELVKKEQLAVVGELAAVIAHEVRNPLAIIANAGASLRKQALTREDYGVLLAILDEETSRLNRLVSDLLRYARPVNVQRTHIGLGDLLERALALAHTGDKTIRRDLKLETVDARLWGDANLLRQVFDNLIDNAVQAMGDTGTLTVRVRTLSKNGADGLGVDIIDTGEGMDTQVRTRALDPFFTTRPSGTGLGLAIVDRIVEAHGGHLDIESRSGEGTTVSVFLPHGSPSEPPPLRTRLPSRPSSVDASTGKTSDVSRRPSSDEPRPQLREKALGGASGLEGGGTL